MEKWRDASLKSRTLAQREPDVSHVPEVGLQRRCASGEPIIGIHVNAAGRAAPPPQPIRFRSSNRRMACRARQSAQQKARASGSRRLDPLQNRYTQAASAQQPSRPSSSRRGSGFALTFSCMQCRHCSFRRIWGCGSSFPLSPWVFNAERACVRCGSSNKPTYASLGRPLGSCGHLWVIVIHAHAVAICWCRRGTKLKAARDAPPDT